VHELVTIDTDLKKILHSTCLEEIYSFSKVTYLFLRNTSVKLDCRQLCLSNSKNIVIEYNFYSLSTGIIVCLTRTNGDENFVGMQSQSL